MVTLDISAGAIFALGVVAGVILGTIGVVVVAYIYSKKKK